ncbi:MAG: PhzF family phenazine biosynthesis protein [Gammaproteobacteria bacterium]
MDLEFYTADVFTDTVFHGAQIAVFPDAQGLELAKMQLIAQELNLPQTVFVFPALEDAGRRRIRIFSPLAEAEFGGHGIIAAAFVLASIGAITLAQPHTPLVLEQKSGAVDVHITRDPRVPPERAKPVFVQFSSKTQHSIDRFVPAEDELAGILSLGVSDLRAPRAPKYTPLLVSCGYPYLIVPISSYAAVRRARFNYTAWSQSAAPATFAREILLFSRQSETPGSDFHARLVGPHIGFDDDPPIASAVPAFTGYLCSHPHIRTGTYSFTIDRGETTARKSLLSVEMNNQRTADLTVRVGGPAVLVSKGLMSIPA